MNNQIIMENYLLVLKSNVEVFVHGTLESSNSDIQELMKESLDTTIDCQRNAYLIMSDSGMYNEENIDSSQISKELKKLNN